MVALYRTPSPLDDLPASRRCAGVIHEPPPLARAGAPNVGQRDRRPAAVARRDAERGAEPSIRRDLCGRELPRSGLSPLSGGPSSGTAAARAGPGDQEPQVVGVDGGEAGHGADCYAAEASVGASPPPSRAAWPSTFGSFGSANTASRAGRRLRSHGTGRVVESWHCSPGSRSGFRRLPWGDEGLAGRREG
jgi:hypothetical protein